MGLKGRAELPGPGHRGGREHVACPPGTGGGRSGVGLWPGWRLRGMWRALESGPEGLKFYPWYPMVSLSASRV